MYQFQSTAMKMAPVQLLICIFQLLVTPSSSWRDGNICPVNYIVVCVNESIMLKTTNNEFKGPYQPSSLLGNVIGKKQTDEDYSALRLKSSSRKFNISLSNHNRSQIDSLIEKLLKNNNVYKPTPKQYEPVPWRYPPLPPRGKPCKLFIVEKRPVLKGTQYSGLRQYFDSLGVHDFFTGEKLTDVNGVYSYLRRCDIDTYMDAGFNEFRRNYFASSTGMPPELYYFNIPYNWYRELFSEGTYYEGFVQYEGLHYRRIKKNGAPAPPEDRGYIDWLREWADVL